MTEPVANLPMRAGGVDVRCEGGSVVCVDALVCGPFAVYCAGGMSTSGRNGVWRLPWVITHRASGMRVGHRFNGLSEALTTVDELAGLPIDWPALKGSADFEALSPEMRYQVESVIHAREVASVDA